MKKSEKYAYIGTAISALIILLILFLVFLPGLKNEEEEGIMISFGELTDGSGSEQLQSEAVAESSPPVVVKEKPDEIITQKDKSVVIPDTKKKPEEVKPAEPVTPPKTDPKPQPKPEPSREEQLRKEQETTKKAEELTSVFKGGDGNTGSGNTQSSNTAGNPVGKGTSGGNSWSLTGRNLSGDLVKPVYTEDQSGEITIKIRVDITGKVTSAVFSRGRGATNELIMAARQAALNTRFTPGDKVVEGTITYNFNLK
jgi:colicin import membrane protein